jgi:hypothetical protein
MKITICGSTNFVPEIKKIRDKLKDRGHEVFSPAWTDLSFQEIDAKKNNREKFINELKPKLLIEHFNKILKSDAILVVNLEKNGIKNYIGGNTFAEIIFAFYYKKKIFFLNPIPRHEMFSHLMDELETVNPVVINGNLDIIK